MAVNYYGMYQGIADNIRRYEREQGADPHERMLETLQAPYNELRNYEEFLSALRGQITAEEAEVWSVYPDYALDMVSRTPDEVRTAVREALRPHVEALSESLARKKFLIASHDEAGNLSYTRTYLFWLASSYIYHPDNSPLSDAILHWWNDLVDRGDSAYLREPYPTCRVMPHEGTITGEQKYGRIPMNLEIPDTREVIPDMDRMETVLRSCRRFAVMRCLCRTAKEQTHSRDCDYPVEDVCILIDQLADVLIESGEAREIDREEAEQIIRRCRDLGLVQMISNAAHPLSVCNCCECCCLCMRSIRRYEDTMAEVSRYAADAAHRENCIGCGACEKICPMEAVSLEGGNLQLNGGKCIGCGLCVSKCPKGVLKMVTRPGAAERVVQEKLDRPYL